MQGSTLGEGIIMEYRNAVYINAENTRVNCEINSPVHGWIPYTLDPSDTDMTVDNDALLASMVLNNDVDAYVASTSSELASAAQAVINGDSLGYLASTDWYVTRFTESGVAVPADVTQARTAARAAIV